MGINKEKSGMKKFCKWIALCILLIVSVVILSMPILAVEKENVQPRASYCSNCGQMTLTNNKVGGPYNYNGEAAWHSTCANYGYHRRVVEVWRYKCTNCSFENTYERTVREENYCPHCNVIF